MSKRSNRVIALVTGAVVVAGAGVAGFRLFDKPEKAVAADGPDPAQTVEIVRADLSQAKDLNGRLGYGAGQTVKSHAGGTITWLPKVGAALEQGDVLFRVDDKPVVLFYGGTPLFRTIGKPAAPPKTPGTPPPSTPPSAPPAKDKPIEGPDVRVVKENLTVLGFLPKTTTDKLTAATTKAIKEWQKSLDLAATGVIDPATVIVLPGAVRVDSIKVALGDPATADILGVTATDKVVTLPVDADSTQGIMVGAKVKLTLPNGKATTGTIRSVGTDAAAPPSDGNPADGGKKPQVAAMITLDQQAASTGVDSGPVTVTVPGASRKGVLVVPVAALLALREGGYAVQVVNGTTSALVGVKTGMFADGNVEISGAGLQAGQKVVTTS
ncbi:peptidoglycan-binding protein [Streptomyces sp. SID13031]|uniref:peptidoglycan-binding protein n=1 Tax=Streptomyces sp. SID13031 TaxID=2706046 RepID=UPI0013C5E60F|nr:peptidoglycan-binding protein [Streptomyces sp. SID13031]